MLKAQKCSSGMVCVLETGAEMRGAYSVSPSATLLDG